MIPVKTVTSVLAISAMFIFLACDKEEEIIIRTNPDLPTEIIIEAKVPSVLYSNKKEIQMDASTMKDLNGNRGLKYLWTCTQFPKEKPFIEYPESSSTPVRILDTGKYTFHLRARDNLGNEGNADYLLTVYQDTLNGPPLVPPMLAKVVTLPEPVSFSVSNVISANPVDRKLSFNWTVVEQPAGSPVIDIHSNDIYAEASGCIPGKYVFQLEVTNELNLKASGLFEVMVLADIFAGTTRIYENLRWASFYDDITGEYYISLQVIDSQISFLHRNKLNTELSLWDFTNQVWMTPNTVHWGGYNGGVFIENYPLVNGVADGTPAKVRITFK